MLILIGKPTRDKGTIMKSNSKARVSKLIVLQAALNFHKHKEKYIYDTQEPYIQKAMQHKFWQRLLGLPSRNRKQAIDYCERNYYWKDYTFCQDYKWEVQEIFKQLVDLTEITPEDFIELSAEDASIVNRYKKIS